eukprot:jgi/Mesvir1/26107/Mv06825-RA.1
MAPHAPAGPGIKQKHSVSSPISRPLVTGRASRRSCLSARLISAEDNNSMEDVNLSARSQMAAKVSDFVRRRGGVHPILNILIANNGIAAVKFIRSIRSWAYETFGVERAIALVGMATPEDIRMNAEHIRMADQFVEVPGGSNNNNYANVRLIVEVAERANVDAVWPGWGHASENPELPRSLAMSGILFLGPGERAMKLLGDKIGSTILAQSVGVPCLSWSGSSVRVPVPGADGRFDDVPADVYARACVHTADEALASCHSIGYPCMIKASWGGGGKGIRLVHNDEEVKLVLPQVFAEVTGSPVFIMKVAPLCRHLEVQLLADNYGNVAALHGRDCSIQRRHQKIIEEGPITVVSLEEWRELERSACRLARSTGYVGAATVEFLYSIEQKEFYFLELNPRLQVEHPVTESITGVNLPSCQVLIGMGVPLHAIPELRTLFRADRDSVGPIDFDRVDPIPPLRHCIAARITSEDTNDGFRPTCGMIQELNFRSTPDVWGYFSVKASGGIHEFSDSQFGHLFAFGKTRAAASGAMVLALKDLAIRGEIRTNVDYSMDLVQTEDFQKNRFHTGWLDERIRKKVQSERPPWYLSVICGAMTVATNEEAMVVCEYVGYLEKGQIPPQSVTFTYTCAKMVIDGVKYTVEVSRQSPVRFLLHMKGSPSVQAEVRQLRDRGLLVQLDGNSNVVYAEQDGMGTRLLINGRTCLLESEKDPSRLVAATSGKIIRYLVPDGSRVGANQPYAEVEVMKMCMPLVTLAGGKIIFQVPEGASVSVGDLIARLELDDAAGQVAVKDNEKPFPELGPPTVAAAKVHLRCSAAIDAARNVLCGYDNDVSLVVANLLECCKDPQLPLLQWHELTGVLASRLPSCLMAELDDIVDMYAAAIHGYGEGGASSEAMVADASDNNSTSDRHVAAQGVGKGWSTLSPGQEVDFPAQALLSALLDYINSCADEETRMARRRLVDPLMTLLAPYASGRDEFVYQVVDGLLEEYLKVEELFAASPSEVDVIEKLREQYREDLAQVVNVVVSHQGVKKKNELVVQLMSAVVMPFPSRFESQLERFAGLMQTQCAEVAQRASLLLEDIHLNRLASNIMRCLLDTPVGERGRHVRGPLQHALTTPLPPTLASGTIRPASDFSFLDLEDVARLSSLPERIKSLVSSHLPVEDALEGLFDHPDTQVQARAIETYIRRLYQPLESGVRVQRGNNAVLAFWKLKPSSAAAMGASTAPRQAEAEVSAGGSKVTTGGATPQANGNGLHPIADAASPRKGQQAAATDNGDKTKGASASIFGTGVAGGSNGSGAVSPVRWGAMLVIPSLRSFPDALNMLKVATGRSSRYAKLAPAFDCDASLSPRGPGSSPGMTGGVGGSAGEGKHVSILYVALTTPIGLPSQEAPPHGTKGGSTHASPEPAQHHHSHPGKQIPSHLAQITTAESRAKTLDEFLQSPAGHAGGSTIAKELQALDVQALSIFSQPFSKLQSARHFFCLSALEGAAGYREVPLLRNIQPPLAQLLELGKLEAFNVHYTHSRDPQWHVYTCTCPPPKATPQKSPSAKSANVRARMPATSGVTFKWRPMSVSFMRSILRIPDAEVSVLSAPDDIVLPPGMGATGSALGLRRAGTQSASNCASASASYDDLTSLLSEASEDPSPAANFKSPLRCSNLVVQGVANMLQSAVDELEKSVYMPQGKPDLVHLFLCMASPLVLAQEIAAGYSGIAQSLDLVFRQLADHYGPALHKWGCTTWEVRLPLQVAKGVGADATTASDVSSSSTPAGVWRVVLANPSGHAPLIDVYYEASDAASGGADVYCSPHAPPRGALHSVPLDAPYPPLDGLEWRRWETRTHGTTFCYDFPGVFEKALEKMWAGNAGSSTHAEGKSHGPANGSTTAGSLPRPPLPLLRSTEVILPSIEGGTTAICASDRQLSTEAEDPAACLQALSPDAPIGGNCIGMVGWLWTLHTREYPEGRQLVVVANDVSVNQGSFGPQEDNFFRAVVEYGCKHKLPVVYIAANSGARIGVAEEVRRCFRVAWTDDRVPSKGFKYIYLTDEDYQKVGSSVRAEQVAENGQTRWVVTDIIGREEGLGVESLSGSGTIAGIFSKANVETFTLTFISGRSVGIGAYLARLGQRCIQKLDQPIILTGFSALNKLLGRTVYTSHMQLGGPKIMAHNGVVHDTVSNDLDGALTILRWLSYVPAVIGAPPSVAPCSDPVTRPVQWSPQLSAPGERMCEPRPAIRGKSIRGTWYGGLFDNDSFMESQAGWARTVVTGRARLGGIPVAVIAVETRTVNLHILADPGMPDSTERNIPQAGQVWFPDSAAKTAQALQEFNAEGLPLFVLANWRGFSGGQRDLFEGVLQAGARIVDNLRTYQHPVFVYVPPAGELRGGAWVVVDSQINPDKIEMYADPSARGGVLEPAGLAEIKYREPQLLETMRRLDPTMREAPPAVLKQALPSYHRVALHFAELHDTPVRMKAKGVITGIVPWASAREFFYWRLRRRLVEESFIRRLRTLDMRTPTPATATPGHSPSASLSSSLLPIAGMSHRKARALVREWFLASAMTVAAGAGISNTAAAGASSPAGGSSDAAMSADSLWHHDHLFLMWADQEGAHINKCIKEMSLLCMAAHLQALLEATGAGAEDLLRRLAGCPSRRPTNCGCETFTRTARTSG